jgi:predicted nucleotide-binding protein
MSTVDRIDSIYEKMSNTPLSVILPMLYPIALECADYEGYCVLSFWSKPASKPKANNRILFDEICKVLIQEGMSEKDAQQLAAQAFEQYLSQRTIKDDKVMVSSAKELEDQIAACNDLIQAVTVPESLHPFDLYTRSQAATNEKAKIIENRRLSESQVAMLHGYITTKLALYRRNVTSKERSAMIEKSLRNSKDVFIIHGHNEAKLLELEKIIRNEFKLNPIILKDQPNSGLTIIDKFEKYATSCSYAFALFTPDDIVTNGKGKQYFQARPNVIFELGWFYANLGRNRVCILEQASEKSEIFSDLQGILRVQFTHDIEECYMKIKRELEDIGIV